MLDPVTMATLGSIGIDILKIWIPAGTAMFGVFKVINWIKSKFLSIESNVVDIKAALEDNMNGLREDIKHQTTSLTTALGEQRQDFRTYLPLMLMQNQQQSQQSQYQASLLAPAPVRAKRLPTKTKRKLK